MSFAEIFAALLTLISVPYGTFGSKHYFSFGGVGAAIYAVIFFENALFFSFLLQLFFIALSVIGFFEWRGREYVSMIHLRDSFKMHLLIVSASLLLALSTTTFFAHSQFPFSDAFLCYMSIYATWLSYSFATVHWVLWVGINIGYAYEYFQSNLIVTSILYVFLAILSSVNAWWWLKKCRHIARNLSA